MNYPGIGFSEIHNDHLGTPVAMTDDNGTVVWSANYTPFGKAEIGVNTMTNNFRFPGQYYDEETGLHYNYHRYYDPETGRYLRADPIGIEGGINLFVYALNNPINLFDLYGLESQACKDDNCKEEAVASFWACQKAASIAQGVCLTTCAVACAPTIAAVGVGYVACLKLCAVGCTVGTLPPRIICIAVWISACK